MDPLAVSDAEPGQPFVVSGAELWEWRSQAMMAAQPADIPPREVDWLLREVAGLDPLSLRLGTWKNQGQVSLTLPLPELQRLWQQRLNQRVPVQYLAGQAHWRQFSLQVAPGVLIPRPETELLIDLAIATLPPTSPLASGAWADLGTGSGAIALGLAVAFPAAQIHAVDVSPAALAIALANAQRTGLGDRLTFYQGSWLHPLEHLQGQLSGLVSNPPYIPTALIPTLQPEVAHHEPHLALDGGQDGLDCIRILVNQAPQYLRSGGVWLIEMMAGQPEAVVKLLEAQGSYHSIEVHADLAGIERFVRAIRH